MTGGGWREAGNVRRMVGGGGRGRGEADGSRQGVGNVRLVTGGIRREAET